MEGIGSFGIPELMILSCVCLVPIIVVVGVVVGLLVVLGRRKPKAEPKSAEPRRAAVVVEPKPAAAATPSVGAKPTPATEPAMKSCASCGADNPLDNAFCEYCGASLAEE
jgi:hypothetical protein